MIKTILLPWMTGLATTLVCFYGKELFAAEHNADPGHLPFMGIAIAVVSIVAFVGGLALAVLCEVVPRMYSSFRSRIILSSVPILLGLVPFLLVEGCSGFIASSLWLAPGMLAYMMTATVTTGAQYRDNQRKTGVASQGGP